MAIDKSRWRDKQGKLRISKGSSVKWTHQGFPYCGTVTDIRPLHPSSPPFVYVRLDPSAIIIGTTLDG
jgi:hypothetical protein